MFDHKVVIFTCYALTFNCKIFPVLISDDNLVLPPVSQVQLEGEATIESSPPSSQDLTVEFICEVHTEHYTLELLQEDE